MLELIRRIKRCEQGATAVEYGLIAAMIVIGMMAALRSTADANSNMWNFVSNEIVGASEGV